MNRLFTGNLQEEDVKKAVATVSDVLKNKRQGANVAPLHTSEFPTVRVVQIPDGTSWVYQYDLKRSDPNEEENPNSCISMLYQFKAHSDRARMLGDVLETYLRDFFLDQLRNTEQLGYALYR